MAIINLRDASISTSSQDEVTILNQSIVDLSAIVEQLALTELQDVTITTPQNGELLVYDFALGEWINSNTVSGDLNVSNKLKLIKNTPPGLNGIPTLQPQNFGDLVVATGDAPSFILSRKTTQFTGKDVLFSTLWIDNTSTNPSTWESANVGQHFTIADQVGQYFVSRVGSNMRDVTVDGSGNIDSFVGQLTYSVYDKPSGGTPASTVALSISTFGTRTQLKDRNSGTVRTTETFIDNDYAKITTDAPNGIEFEQHFTVSANQIDFTNLPTSDPLVAGRLWNDAGTMKISAG